VALLAVNFDTNLRFGRSSRLVVLQFFGWMRGEVGFAFVWG
jgi:hypothetical protein